MVVCNLLKSLRIFDRFFVDDRKLFVNTVSYCCLRGPVVVYLFYHKQKPPTGRLACSSYTTSSKNSKMNFPSLEKEKNAVSGSSTHSSRLLYRFALPERPISFDASKRFLASTRYAKKDSILSWHRLRFHGNGYGGLFGK